LINRICGEESAMAAHRGGNLRARLGDLPLDFGTVAQYGGFVVSHARRADAVICGYGQAAPNPLPCVLK